MRREQLEATGALPEELSELTGQAFAPGSGPAPKKSFMSGLMPKKKPKDAAKAGKAKAKGKRANLTSSLEPWINTPEWPGCPSWKTLWGTCGRRRPTGKRTD